MSRKASICSFEMLSKSAGLQHWEPLQMIEGPLNIHDAAFVTHTHRRDGKAYL